jgi:hypothetical protein
MKPQAPLGRGDVQARRQTGLMTIQRISGVRLALMYAVLLAFLVQGYATQTHIHIAGQSDFTGVASDTATKATKNGPAHNLPSKDDPANCPICQQIALSGAFIAPAALLPLLPEQLGFVSLPAAEIAIAAAHVSHNWQSRAPPAH